MRLSLTAIVPLFAVAQALINGIAAPSTIKPGEAFNLRLVTEIGSGSSQDLTIAIGWAPDPAHSYYPGMIGLLAETLNVTELIQHMKPSQQNTTVQMTIPEAEWNVPGDDVVITASMFTLSGATKAATLLHWGAIVKFGDQTSTVYKDGQRVFPKY